MREPRRRGSGENILKCHTQSLSQQLDGRRCDPDSKTHQEDSISIEYVFPARARVANAFFYSKPVSETDVLTCRLQVISDLVTLCAKQELPQKPSQFLEKVVEMIVDPVIFPLKLLCTQFLFSLGDNLLPDKNCVY